MIINNNVINAFQEGKGEGYYIHPKYYYKNIPPHYKL